MQRLRVTLIELYHSITLQRLSRPASNMVKDPEDAITLHRAALRLTPLGHPDRDVSLSSLASALKVRFDRSQKPEDLEDTIALHREDLEVTPVDHPNRDISLTTLH